MNFVKSITVSGLYDRGVKGDKKIRSQVAEVLNGYPADGAVLVSDGVEGEELAPVIQSLVPIISLKRIRHKAQRVARGVIHGVWQISQNVAF